jgi:hypothetical protein
MTVGNQLTVTTVNSAITNLSVQTRILMTAISNLSVNVNGQGGGLALLEAIGYASADATSALAAISYLNTVAGVYFGTAAQTPAFNFNQELSQFWGGQ